LSGAVGAGWVAWPPRPTCPPSSASPPAVAAFAGWAREVGRDALVVSAYAANRRALRFYAAEGFRDHTVQLLRRR
jgi:GNAT superfamily N-acetyltransferase